VIADNCDPTDTTESLAAEYNLRCLVVNNKNVHLNRELGLQYTRCENIIFLDADDWLQPTYISSCVEILKHQKMVGIVTTHLDRGDHIQYHLPTNINKNNFIHAGSMVRRTCLIGSDVFRKNINHQSHADWYIWKLIVNDGWQLHVIPQPLYYYRTHKDNMLSGVLRLPYYNQANLVVEPLTVVIPFCRDRYWGRLYEWLKCNSKDYTHLTILDSSNIPSRVKHDLANLDCNTTYIRLPIKNGLADEDREVFTLTYLEVQCVMPQIYRYLRQVTTEFMFILEDDVLPPDGCITKLLQSMDVSVAGVSGVVRSRFCNRVIAGHDFQSSTGESLEGTGVQRVGYTGFGCLILRKSTILSVPPFVCGNYDLEFCNNINKLKQQWLIDWDVHCVHGDK
jgi:hypothetical protein